MITTKGCYTRKTELTAVQGAAIEKLTAGGAGKKDVRGGKSCAGRCGEWWKDGGR